MLHLRHCTHLSLHNSSFSINRPKKLIFLSGFSVNGDTKLFGLKKIRRYAVDKDSEFEVDPDKAREALRKLDVQFQTLSKKQANPPKIRAADIDRSSSRQDEDINSGFTGSFLSYAASALLVFTIFYNVIFYLVIKPSVDGPDEPYLKSASLEQSLSRSESLFVP